ncbi:MAG: flagella basal body P-ring formation protein FlgA [Sphingobium sp.]
MGKFTNWGLGVGATLLAAHPALAQQKFENLDRLDGLVSMTVGANIGEPGGAIAPVDRRLRLAACPKVPEVSGPMFGAAIVTCEPLAWRIRVPLKVGGEAANGRPVAQQMSAGNYALRPTQRPVAAQTREVVVKRGDAVEMRAGNDSFIASREMIADEDGTVGQMIRVRADKKADPVMAVVAAMGIVQAPGF